MMFNYNHLNQGFRGTGGVPFNGMPAIPKINCGALMEQHQPYIASIIYQDMAGRKTQISDKLLSAMADNTFHNETFTTAMQLVSDYAEYLIGAKLLAPEIAINTAVPIVNETLLYSFIQQNQQAAQLVTGMEKARYHQSATKLNSLKKDIKNYLSRGGNMYPNQQYPQQPHPQYYQQPPMGYQPQMPVPPQQYYQQQQMPAQQQQGPNLLQRALARGTPVGQPQQFAYPQQMPPAQFQQQMPPQMQFGFPQQQMQYPFPPQPQAPMGFPYQQQGFGQPQMNPAIQSMLSQQQNMRMPPQAPQGAAVTGYRPSFSNAATAVNPNTPSAASYKNPWETQPNPEHRTQQYQQQPVQQNQVQQPYQPSFTNSFQPSQLNQQPQQQTVVNQQPIQLDRNLIAYENKVREKARQLGLPADTASIEALEQLILRYDPNNGFIDPKRPYLVMSGKAMEAPPPLNNVDFDKLVKRVTDEELHYEASKSKGELVKDANGNYIYRKEAGNPQSEIRIPSVMTNGNLAEYSNEAKPYPFATMNGLGKWCVKEQDYKRIPVCKRNGFEFLSCDVFREITYTIDSEGKIDGYTVSVKEDMKDDYEEFIVNYELHNNKRFFDPMLESDFRSKVDGRKAIEAFSQAQVQHKVADLVRRLEEEANLIKEGEAQVLTDMTIHLNNIVEGSLMYDDYQVIGQAMAASELPEELESGKNVSIRYTHACISPVTYSGEAAKKLKKLINLTDYQSIVEFLGELDKDDELASLATTLNNRATYYVNNILLAVFNIGRTEFYMESFVTDVMDVVEEMGKRGLGDKFNKFAARLVQTILYAYDNNSNLFKQLIGEDSEEGVERVAFGLVRDVTTLPIRSSEIVLYNENKRAVVTEDSHPSLFKLISTTVNSLHPRTAEIVFVTLDNRQMYIYPTTTPNAYAVVQNTVLVDTKKTA